MSGFIQIYLILLFLGLGPSLWIFHTFKESKQALFAYSPFVGYAICTIFCVYPLSYSFIPNHFTFIFLIIGMISLVFSILYFLILCPKFDPSLYTIPYIYILGTILIFIFINNYHDGILSTFLGIDLSGYTESSRLLSRGENLASISTFPVDDILVKALL